MPALAQVAFAEAVNKPTTEQAVKILSSPLTPKGCITNGVHNINMIADKQVDYRDIVYIHVWFGTRDASFPEMPSDLRVGPDDLLVVLL